MALISSTYIISSIGQFSGTQDGHSETARVLMATGALVKAQANRRKLFGVPDARGFRALGLLITLADALQVAGLLADFAFSEWLNQKLLSPRRRSRTSGFN